MTEYAYIYITLQSLSEASWKQTRDIISYINLLREKSESNHYCPSCDNITTSLHLSEEPPSQSKNFNKPAAREYSDLKKWRKKYPFLKDKKCCYVIVVPIEKSTQRESLIPFLYLRVKFKIVTLCLDLSKIISSVDCNKIRFSLGHYFTLNMDATDPLFVISFVPSHKYHTKKLPSAQIDGVSVVLKDFSPLIRIDETTVNELFSRTLYDTLDIIKKANSVKQPSEYIEWYKNESNSKSAIHFILATSFQIAKRIKQIDLHIFNSINANFKFESPAKYYVFLLLFDQVMRWRANTQIAGKGWEKAILKCSKSDLHNYTVLAKRFVTGIKELAENIVFHTNDKTGYLSFQLQEMGKFNIGFPDKSFGKEIFKKYLKGKQISSPRKHTKYKQICLKVTIRDFYHLGITDTYQRNQNNPSSKANLLKLDDFFIGRYNLFCDLARSDFRNMAQLGLKTFAHLALNHHGFFHVETNKNGEKQEIIMGSDVEPTLRKLTSSVLNGTHFQILFPIEDPEPEQAFRLPLSLEGLTFIDVLKNWISGNDSFVKPKIIVGSLTPYNVKDKRGQVGYIDRIVEDLKKSIGGIEKRDRCLVFDLENAKVCSVDLSMIIKICSSLQLQQDCPIRYVVLINVGDADLTTLIEKITILGESGTLWGDSNYLYIYDQQARPFIVHGSTIPFCNKINELASLYYGSYRKLPSARQNAKKNNNNQQINILPLEVLVSVNHDSQQRTTLFERATSNILDYPIDENGFGIKISTAHIRLGSKIHINNFFEAEALFQHSFYAERFAFLVAQDILDRITTTKLLLLAYGQYSEMMMERIQTILLNKSKKSNPIDFKGFCTCRDITKMSWIGIERIDNDTIKSIKSNENITIGVIVPIGSTLTTWYKIAKSFSRYLRDKHKTTEDAVMRLINYNICLIIVRDGNHNNFLSEPTEAEKQSNWEKIDTQKQLIFTSDYPKGIKYFVLKYGSWFEQLHCPKCFPIYKRVPFEYLRKEKPLYKTGKTSLVSRTIIKWPKIYLEEKDKQSLKNIRFLRKCLKYGHLKRKRNHFKYYTDTIYLLKHHNEDIKNWLRDLKNQGQITSEFNIIVTPSHNTNMRFVHLVNDILFRGTAIVIRLDFNDDWIDNFTVKYSYLAYLPQKVNFYFVDDALLTGKTYYTVKDIMRAIGEGDGDKAHSKYIFSNIIVMLDRLSSSKYGMGSIVHSFIKCLVPFNQNLHGKCPLCTRQEEFRMLAEHSNLDRLRAEFKRRKNLLNPKAALGGENQNSERYFNMLNYANKLYLCISQGKTDEEKSQNINQLWSRCGDNLQKKRDFLYAVSSTPFLHYKKIKEIVFKILLEELVSFCNIHSGKESSKVDISPSLKDFDWLVSLMRCANMIGTNFFMRKEVIICVWTFFDKIIIKYGKYLENIKKHITDEKICKLFYYSNSYIQKNKNNDKWPKSASFRNMYTKNEKSKYEYITKIYTKDITHSVCGSIEIILQELVENNYKCLWILIYNYFNFSAVYTMHIKINTFNDDAKCMWIEHLLRTGTEVRGDKIEYRDLTNIPNNELYKIKNNILISETTKKLFKSFLVATFIDNNTIINRALNYLEQEPLNNKITERLKKSFGAVLDTNESKEYASLLAEAYYYKMFRNFTSGLESNNRENLLRTYKLRLLLKNLLSKQGALGISPEVVPQDTGKSLNLLCQAMGKILGAKMGFFVIKRYHSEDTRQFRSSTSQNAFIVGAYGDNELENSLPKAINGEYESCKLLYPKERDHFNEEKWHTFSTSPSWDGLETKWGKERCWLRFFSPKSQINYGLRAQEVLGCAYFILDKKSSKDRDRHSIELKEKIRLLLSVKYLVQNYLEANFLNDNFARWIESEDLNSYIRNSHDKYQHGAGKILTDLMESIRQDKKSDTKAHSLLICSNIFIGELYFHYLVNPESIKKSFMNPFWAFPSQCFEPWFKTNLKELSKYSPYKNVNINITINDNTEYKLRKKFNKTDIRLFTIALVWNAIKHTNRSNRTDITVNLTKNGIDVSNNNLEGKFNKEYVFNLNSKLENDECDRLSGGITLFTINKYMKSNYNNSLLLDYINNKFTVFLTF